MPNTLTFQLSDIFLNKDIDEDFKCGICMDILKFPILCGGGHSWCQDCIKSNNKTKCPICPKAIDINNPTPNYSLKSMIDKMICRCPNNNSDNSNNHNNNDKNNSALERNDELEDQNSSKKRKTSCSSTSNNNNNNINEDCCCWIGRYDQLENHLKDCVSIPSLCAFAIHGCEFVGSKRLLEDHYNNNNHIHNMMLSNKIVSLENSSKLTIKWTFNRVAEKLRTKKSIWSDPFDVVATNGNKYKCIILARFGTEVDGKSLGLFIYHISCRDYCDDMPIDLGGTSFTLNNDNPEKSSVVYLFKDFEKIYQVNQGSGTLNFVADLNTEGFINNNDQIVIIAKVKIDNSEKSFTSA